MKSIASLSCHFFRSVFLLSLPCATVLTQQPPTLSRIMSPILLDGVINETSWAAINPLPLTMEAPAYEGTLSERTEIRIAYDDEYLYVAASCFDSDPSAIRGNSLTRDGLKPSDDSFFLILDTFNDNENALSFITNPAGLREDWAIFNDAEAPPLISPFNTSWSTFWDVATTRTDSGWFAEMRIPFSSLRFEDDKGRVIFGLIAWRYIARKNEIQIFPNIPPKWTWAPIKPSVAQDVVLEGVYRRNPVYVTPYGLGGFGRNFEFNNDSTAFVRQLFREREIGLDVKYGPTSNLTLDLTFNTDFAQVEADDQQVNLTRFSLFFPEKRLFFQERSSIFDVSMGGDNRLFYSRRVGLSEEGPVRIYGGGRLIGRLGAWDLGFLDMQTAKSIDLPSENFGVLRLRRQVFNDNSYAGGMFTSRIGNDGSYNHAYGLDAIIRVIGDDYILLNWAQSFDHELVKTKSVKFAEVTRSRITWEKRAVTGFGYEGSLSHVGPNFDPAMGFVPRLDYTRIGDRLFYGWLSDESSPLYTHVATLRTIMFFRNNDMRLESSEIGPEWAFSFKSGAFAQVSAIYLTELLKEPFDLSDSLEVPVGNYHFYNINLYYQTPWGGLLSSSFSLDAGTFYDGTRISFRAVPAWSISRFFELSGEYQFNSLRFRKRSENLHTHIGRCRFKVQLSTQFSATTFLQYTSESHSVILNFRVRYNPREGNDLYLVYNEGVNTDRFRALPVRPYSDTRTVLLKYSHTFLL